MARVLDRRTLSRTALERQLLLERSAMPVIEAVQRLVALQAQDPNLPYYSLWTRLDGFRQEDFTGRLVDRSVVRGPLLRGTQHVAAAADYRWVRPLVEPILRAGRQAAFGRVSVGWDLDELAAEVRGLLKGRTLTRPQLAKALAERWPDRDRQALGWSAQALVPVVHPPPSGTWNTHGATPFVLADEWIGPLEDGVAAERLVRRYLGAFGPASAKDFQMWSGLRRMDEVFERLRPGLQKYRDENGVELFDLPEAAPAEDGRPAPVRFLGDLDNLMLAYADRSRLMTAEQRKVICVGAWVKPTLLVDGRVRGIWRIEHDRKAGRAGLGVELFEPLRDEGEVRAEAARLLEFAAPEGEHEVRVGMFGTS
ncbi:winged helix DNA-binding domain-containing protein [Actinomadura fibrosa]|uniref:Winged helix DNA-binding domain-containing protein n=1 Tax=Actinomadura fibrosa TaxID=111802 RepID=A0ABW2Y141_9ACTN|nr:winged helix DNA-binding domain-containing protein [Actinomadura fibrosa]